MTENSIDVSEVPGAITQKLGVPDLANMCVLKYGVEVVEELRGLATGTHLYEAVIVDATLCGFLFPSELLVDAARIVDSLVEIKGALIFLRCDSAFAIIRENFTAAPSFRVFDSYADLFEFSPTLTKYIKAALGKDAGFEEGGADLSQQILMAAVPVLTEQGLQRKTNITTPGTENHLLALIDNFSPVAALAQRSRLSESQILDGLKELETKKLIFPVFAKVPFLTSYFKNRRSFTIEEYMINCKILNQQNIDELVLELQGTSAKERMNLGALAVKRGKINSRMLEIALADQAFYGQSEGMKSKSKMTSTATSEEAKVQSLVGHLGSTDPMSLLQNMATNRETGVLSVENRDMQFKAHFEAGKPMNARIGKLHGNNAVMEFASAWNQGIFVFIKRPPSEDLTKDTCKITKPLDKLLLDAALAQDNTQVVWNKLPRGADSILEKVESTKEKLEGDPIIEPKEKKPITKSQMEMVKRVWDSLDGLTTISRTIKLMGDITTSDFSWAIGMLLEYKMATVPDGDVSGPISKFQRLVAGIREQIGNEKNTAFLRLSFRDSLGYSGRARVFILSHRGDVDVDMAAARSAGTSLSTVLADLDNWQVKYIEYVSQELDRGTLLNIIRSIHEKDR
ncbi:MAG: DUF4388 domain-containing protein [Candidatus Obscuribacterales bacterium]|nr:DUF4388 domain-containing protein [Candidatus Obscuribacterales bacterium]